MLRRLFTESPMRGFRWFDTSLGLVLTGASIYLAVTWPETADNIMLIFPLAIFLVGVALLWLGLISEDETIQKVLSFCSSISPF